jgi:hypothetical protein
MFRSSRTLRYTGCWSMPGKGLKSFKRKAWADYEPPDQAENLPRFPRRGPFCEVKFGYH